MYLNLTYFDYIIIFTIIYSVVAAFFRGFIKSATSFLGFISYIIGCYLLSEPLEKIVKVFLNNDIIAKISAVILSNILSLIVISFVSKKISFITESIRGNIIDRSFGFAFGFIRGVIIACFIFSTVSFISPFFINQSVNSANQEKNEVLPLAVKNAKTYQLLNLGSSFILKLLPKEISHINFHTLTNKDHNHKESSDEIKLDNDALMKLLEGNNVNLPATLDKLNKAINNSTVNDSTINDITNVIKSMNNLNLNQ